MPDRRSFAAASWLLILLPIIAIGTCSYFAFAEEYNRGEWHPRWEDADRDCQDTRQEVLIEESIIEVELDSAGCRVVSGLWVDMYSGGIFRDPLELDIDHLVPLKEAHESGGYKWTEEAKHTFANYLSDPRALIAVSARENRSKGAKDPAQWMPSNAKFHCKYIRDWRGIKDSWGLEFDAKEEKAIVAILKRCREIGR